MADRTEREPGYYWVRNDNEWKVAEYATCGMWFECGDEVDAPEAYYDEIGEKIERREGKPQ